MLAKELLKLIQTKAKTGAQMKTSAMLELMQEQSQVVSGGPGGDVMGVLC